MRTGQALYTFWHTGDERWLHEAVDPSFTDNTLPPGRPQGIDGPAHGLGDLPRCRPRPCLRTGRSPGDRRQAGRSAAFHRHFSGTVNGIAGQGHPVDFVAFDIQHVGSDRIVEDWHLEDNLTFLLQAGIATVAHA